ncbi:hypothetical protein FDECE_11595 [Fusarium decemcellulare]|nr:hypothetical protein FDECE_11595 [Fusarium decemcellulare]
MFLRLTAKVGKVGKAEAKTIVTSKEDSLSVRSSEVSVSHHSDVEQPGPLPPPLAVHLPDSSSTPSPPNPLVRNEDAVEIRSTQSHRNLGVFAKQDFPSRHKIILERPAISCIHFTQGWASYKNVGVVWNSLPEQRRTGLSQAFTSLRHMPTDKDVDWSQRKKLETFIEEYAFSDPQRRKAHIFRLASHINHACTRCANAEHWTDSVHPHPIKITLVRDVKKDEEIFIHYGKKRMSFGCAVCGIKGNPKYPKLEEGKGSN